MKMEFAMGLSGSWNGTQWMRAGATLARAEAEKAAKIIRETGIRVERSRSDKQRAGSEV
jgi:hypothetical protein